MRTLASQTLLAAFAFSLAAGALEYHVSPSGLDEVGRLASPSVNSPCKSISFVLGSATLRPGDIVYLRGGTYVETVRLLSRHSGSAANPVTIATYANEDVVITTNTENYPLSIYDSGGWTEHIKIDGSGQDQGKHLTITTTRSSRCVMIRYARGIWLRNCIVENAVTDDCIKLTSKNQEFGVDDDTGARDCVIENCIIRRGANYGIKITGFGSRNNMIRNNEIYFNGHSGSSSYGVNVSGSGYESNTPRLNTFANNLVFSNAVSGIHFTVTSENIVTGNRIFGNGTDEPGNGVGLGSSTTRNRVERNSIFGNSKYGVECYGAHDNTVARNTIASNSREQIRVQNGSSGNVFLGNTVYGPLTCLYLAKDTKSTGITNNILFATGKEPTLHNGGGGTASLSHNCIFRAGSPLGIYWNSIWHDLASFQASTGSSPNSLAIDPQFMDTQASDFRLASTSPAIDAGTFVGHDFLGTNPDLGAHELGNRPRSVENLRLVPAE